MFVSKQNERKIVTNTIVRISFLLINLTNKFIQDRREKGLTCRFGHSILSHSWFWIFSFIPLLSLLI